MLHRYIVEALDRTFQDILKSTNPFGGIIIVFTGDFKQVLPIVPSGDRAAIVNATLKNSFLWNTMGKFSLTLSMRHGPEMRQWVDYLEGIGDGSLNNETGYVELQHVSMVENISSLVSSVFPDLFNTYTDRAILSPLNVPVDEINTHIVGEAPGLSQTYPSINTPITEEECIEYSIEFLNTIESGSLPPQLLIPNGFFLVAK